MQHFFCRLCVRYSYILYKNYIIIVNFGAKELWRIQENSTYLLVHACTVHTCMVCWLCCIIYRCLTGDYKALFVQDEHDDVIIDDDDDDYSDLAAAMLPSNSYSAWTSTESDIAARATASAEARAMMMSVRNDAATSAKTSAATDK